MILFLTYIPEFLMWIENTSHPLETQWQENLTSTQITTHTNTHILISTPQPIIESPYHGCSYDDNSSDSRFSPIHLLQAQDFQKGDISINTTFKDDHQYDSWYCDTYATPCVHGTEHVFHPTYNPTQPSSALLWIVTEMKCFVFSVSCKNPQTLVGHMLIKHHSDSSDAQLNAMELHHHYETSIHAQTHAQDICASMASLCIANRKGTFQSLLNHWESQWLLINKSTPIDDQESPAICKNVLSDAICSNSDFFQINHLDKLRQAQGNSEITYHKANLHTTAFQLDTKRPKTFCSHHSGQQHQLYLQQR